LIFLAEPTTFSAISTSSEVILLIWSFLPLAWLALNALFLALQV
jgi:hypothetical protein